MSTRSRQGKSDSQANAEALARRDTPYTAASEVSFRVRWDFHRREPRDLHEAERMVRRAYVDEVPGKLHEGPDSIGEGGTPKMTPAAEGYIFGRAQSSDAKRDPETGAVDAVSYYHAPFRAALAALHGAHDHHPQGYVCENAQHRRAAIVAHVTIGSQGAAEAAIAEGVPSWCARLVAEDAIRVFLRTLSDLKFTLPKAEVA